MADQTKPTVRIGDKDYAFKRVNLATWKKHLEFMKASARMAAAAAAGKAPDSEQAIGSVMEMAEIIHECIARADPSVQLDTILEGLDQGNIGEIYGAVMAGSSFVPSGESKPAVAA